MKVPELLDRQNELLTAYHDSGETDNEALQELHDLGVEYGHHIKTRFPAVLAELKRLNAELAAYIAADDMDLPQCTDADTLADFEEVAV